MRIEKRNYCFRDNQQIMYFSIYDTSYREIICYYEKDNLLYRRDAFEEYYDILQKDIDDEFFFKCSPLLEITKSEHIEIEKNLYENI